MFTTINGKKILFSLIGVFFVLCLFSTIGCGGGVTNGVTIEELRQRLRAAESAKKAAETAKRVAESDRDTAIQRARTAESARKIVESDRDTTIQRLKTAETAKKAAEFAKKTADSKRDSAIKRAEIAEREKKSLEKLVSLVPQAEIIRVQPDVKKKEMDISVTFSIKNRKDIDGRVYAYFYFQDGEKLRSKRGNQIVITERFTPKSATETLTVTLSMPYDKLNTSQPSKLKFNVRIYDSPTQSFLDQGPYTVSFFFYPNKDNPVQLTYR